MDHIIEELYVCVLQHMIKYKYIPFTHGKAHYKGKADTGKIVGSWLIPVVLCSANCRAYSFYPKNQ